LGTRCPDRGVENPQTTQYLPCDASGVFRADSFSIGGHVVGDAIPAQVRGGTSPQGESLPLTPSLPLKVPFVYVQVVPEDGKLLPVFCFRRLTLF
jgi:hypothetical protein